MTGNLLVPLAFLQPTSLFRHLFFVFLRNKTRKKKKCCIPSPADHASNDQRFAIIASLSFTQLVGQVRLVCPDRQPGKRASHKAVIDCSCRIIKVAGSLASNLQIRAVVLSLVQVSGFTRGPVFSKKFSEHTYGLGDKAKYGMRECKIDLGTYSVIHSQRFR